MLCLVEWNAQAPTIIDNRNLDVKFRAFIIFSENPEHVTLVKDIAECRMAKIGTFQWQDNLLSHLCRDAKIEQCLFILVTYSIDDAKHAGFNFELFEETINVF